MRSELEQVEAVLANALTSADPWRAFVVAREDAALAPNVRAQLAHVDEDGLRIAGLLVAKLRFERIMNGSRIGAEWFERDPAAFTEAFRRYHTSVPPQELMPGLEGRRFETWLDAQANT